MPNNPSPICTVNGMTLPLTGRTGADVPASSTITIKLVNTDFVVNWSIAATSADDVTYANGNLAAVNNSKIVNHTNYTATFVMPPMDGYRGAGLQFTSIVNNGMFNGNSTTFGVWVDNDTALAAIQRLFFGGESNEGNATVGNAEQLNDMMMAIINGQGGGGSGFVAGGDLSGTNLDQTVIGLYNHALASTTPLQSYLPIFDTSPNHYSIRQLTQDDIAAGFTITSFAGGSTVEIGATVTNPAFTASYNMTPSSAQITNTDGMDSPLILFSPYTSGTVVGSFYHTSQTSVVFTLTAVATSTKTANSNINFYPRSFSGVGSAGATSTVTASGNTAVLSTGDVLASAGLFSTDVGQTFVVNPINQYVYLLLTGGSHTFIDTNTGFAFAMNSPTSVSFTNQNSSVVAMYLYQSTYQLDASFSVKVAT